MSCNKGRSLAAEQPRHRPRRPPAPLHRVAARSHRFSPFAALSRDWCTSRRL